MDGNNRCTGEHMNTITTQQSQQQIDLLKVTFLFLALGISAYVTYRIGRSLSREITSEI